MPNIEEIVKKLITEFESKPIATTIKGLIVLWLLKQVIAWWKK